MADIGYVRPFESKRYFLWVGSIFFILTGAFVVLTVLQGLVHFPTTNGTVDVTGCSTAQDGNPLGTSCGYFFNNVGIAMVAWAGGFAIVGPFYILWQNSMNIGGHIGRSILNGNISDIVFLLPHGIIEIPAIILSIGIGVYNANMVLENMSVPSLYDIKYSMIHTGPYMLIVIGTLGIASVIEANISPVVAGWV